MVMPNGLKLYKQTSVDRSIGEYGNWWCIHHLNNASQVAGQIPTIFLPSIYASGYQQKNDKITLGVSETVISYGFLARKQTVDSYDQNISNIESR